MSRAKRDHQREHRDAEQREEDERRGVRPEASWEAADWAEETGYRPSVNQRRHEPMPASHDADHGQEAVRRNEEHAGNRLRARPSPRARRRNRG
jgi:hypothetical protein